MSKQDEVAERTKEYATDEAVQEALMNLLEVKLAAFMGRADLSSSPPEDKVAIRAAYFLGVSAGMSLANTIAGADGERAGEKFDKADPPSSTDEA